MNEPRGAGYRTVALAAAVVVGATTLLTAVQESSPSRPKFVAHVDLMQFDVSVVSRKTHEPISHLKADDFVVTESGKSKSIATFEEVSVPSNSTAPDWIDTAPPDVLTNQQAPSRVVVIAIDDFGIPNGSIPTTRQIAFEIVKQLSPGDRAAVVHLFNRRYSQDFTSDRGLLSASIDHISSSAVFSGGGACMDVSCVSQLFKAIASSLANVPGGRKALVYISGVRPAAPFHYDSRLLASPYVPGDVQRLFDDLRRGNIAVYVLDAVGLGYSATHWSPLAEFATSTGGWMADASIAPAIAIRHLLSETDSYYILGLDLGDPIGSDFRDFKITVKRDDAEVHGRAGYFRKPLLSAQPQTPLAGGLAVADRAIAASMPVTELPVRLSAIPDLAADASLVIDFTIDAAAGLHNHELAFIVAAFDDNWKTQALIRRSIAVSPTVGRAFDVLEHLNVPAGRYQVRAGVVDRVTGRSGSVYASVQVPDRRKASLLTSGLFVLRPEPLRVDKATWIITNTRRFSPDERMKVQMTIRAPGKVGAIQWPIIITDSVKDHTGQIVVSQTTNLTKAEVRPDGLIGHEYEPLWATLAQGRYVISIDIAAGAEKSGLSVPVEIDPRVDGNR
jgi:VWFA-related protein